MEDNDDFQNNVYQTFLERFRSQLPAESRAASMAQIESKLELMADGHSESAKLITQSVEIAKKRFHLGPVAEFKTLEDIYQNLVLVNKSFTDTKRMFGRMRSDQLTCDLVENDARTVATIRIGRFTFASVEAESITHLTRKKALHERGRIMGLAKREFMSAMQKHCYSINEKFNPNPNVEDKYFEVRQTVGKSDDLDLKYYRRILKRFKRNDCGIDLIFSKEMDKMDRICLIDIAKELNLRIRFDKRTSTLIVFSRRTGPDIVSDMINGKHPDLSEMFELDPPGAVFTAASECEPKLDQIFTVGSLKYAFTDASAVEVYKSLSHLEAVWIAQKFIL